LCVTYRGDPNRIPARTPKNQKNDSRPNTIDMPWPITKFIDQPGRPHDLWDLLFFN
jgi:hypothetical protein